jgi:hypothetical protein
LRPVRQTSQSRSRRLALCTSGPFTSPTRFPRTSRPLTRCWRSLSAPSVRSRAESWSLGTQTHPDREFLQAQPMIHQFADRIGGLLTADDDRDLWAAAIQTIIFDAEILCHRGSGRNRIFVQIGSCSHWMSPHNKGSWFGDVRFAWPTGYGWHGSLIYGLPEFDWCLTWRWKTQDSRWEPVDGVDRKHRLVFRVALPARTAKHVRAVAHTLWMPGPPTAPNRELLQGYAFAKVKDEWRCAATVGDERPYEWASDDCDDSQRRR